MKEIGSTYAADRNLLNSQLKALPSQADAQIKGLDAKLAVANDNILQGARGRGLGFSGIPIAEQAQYAATEYAPAVAGVRKSQNDQRSSILSSLNGLARDQRSQAESIFQADRQFSEQKRQFDLQMAEQRAQRAAQERAARAAAYQASAGDYLGALLGGGGGGGGAASQAAGPRMVRRKDGGFNITDAQGRAISAAQYARLKNIPFRDVVSTMARSGDTGAKAILGFVGNDFGFNARKAASGPNNTARLNSLYRAFTWGVR